MRFDRKDKWHAESPEGYRVSVAFVMGRLVYSAWAPRKDKKIIPLGCFRDDDPNIAAQQAKLACAKHYNGEDFELVPI